MRTFDEVMAAKKRKRELLREMKERNIKRFSCFNGGHTPESHRYNLELFRLDTIINPR